jgi:hypothetical protein
LKDFEEKICRLIYNQKSARFDSNNSVGDGILFLLSLREPYQGGHGFVEHDTINGAIVRVVFVHDNLRNFCAAKKCPFPNESKAFRKFNLCKSCAALKCPIPNGTKIFRKSILRKSFAANKCPLPNGNKAFRKLNLL